MKVVLDTNVLMSAIFWKGQPGEILHLWSRNLFTLVISEEIYAEYKRVSSILSKKYKLSNSESILDLIALNAHFVNPQFVEIPTM
jgi:putative PIN family toxin of toxin-antitoxin system